MDRKTLATIGVVVALFLASCLGFGIGGKPVVTYNDSRSGPARMK